MMRKNVNGWAELELAQPRPKLPSRRLHKEMAPKRQKKDLPSELEDAEEKTDSPPPAKKVKKVKVRFVKLASTPRWGQTSLYVN